MSERRTERPASVGDPGSWQGPVRVRGMLLVGAAGRKAGKTLLATRIIEALPTGTRVAGAKATTVQDDEQACPRGGEGCGACSSFEGGCLVTEERGDAEGKDTTRLLEAGASPVFWLRVRRSSLAIGAGDLVKRLGSATASVCESNSLRTVIEPDLFVIVKHRDQAGVRRSCKVVWPLADAIVTFDGEEHDHPATDFSLVGGHWSVRRRATAIVLVGGADRMGPGADPLARRGGRTVIEHTVGLLVPHFREILVAARDPERFRFLGLPVVHAQDPGSGQLMSVAASLEASSHEINLVVPHDLSGLPVDLVFRMLREARSEAEIVGVDEAAGSPDTVFAVFKKSVRTSIERTHARGGRGIDEASATCRTVRVPRLGSDENDPVPPRWTAIPFEDPL